jgi:hypothetical protein
MSPNLVIPAQAGTQILDSREDGKAAKGLFAFLRAFAPLRETILGWVPAFAGMTKKVASCA